MPIKNVNISHAVINEHGPIFNELIELIIECLRSGGVQTSYTTNQLVPDRLNVIVGPTIFLSPEVLTKIRSLAHSYIVFQLEALNSEHGFFLNNPSYLEFLRGGKQVWDYSQQNTRYLAQHGVSNARYIPIGYSPRLERIINPSEHDIDVLFYGSFSPRRNSILEELRHRGFKVVALFGKYGMIRDTHIARTKINLNVHQFQTTHTEQLRLAYLLNNKRFVISETSDDNPYGDGVVFCDYNDIVARCTYYLRPGMEKTRMKIAKLGYERLKHIPMARSIIKALAELTAN